MVNVCYSIQILKEVLTREKRFAETILLTILCEPENMNSYENICSKN